MVAVTAASSGVRYLSENILYVNSDVNTIPKKCSYVDEYSIGIRE